MPQGITAHVKQDVHSIQQVACSTAQTTGVDAVLHAGDKVAVAVCSAHEPRRRQALKHSPHWLRTRPALVKQPALTIHLHTRMPCSQMWTSCSSCVATVKSMHNKWIRCKRNRLHQRLERSIASRSGVTALAAGHATSAAPARMHTPHVRSMQCIWPGHEQHAAKAHLEKSCAQPEPSI